MKTAGDKGVSEGRDFQRPLFFEPQGDLMLPVEKEPCISEGAFELKFRSQPHGRSIKSSLRANLAAQHSAKNIGNFFVRAYTGLFRHEREADFAHEEFVEAGDERIQFRPDLRIEGLMGIEYTEVKGKTLNGAQVDFGKVQIETYAWAMLRDYYLGKRSYTDFAIFRYGHSHKNLKLHSKTVAPALETLAKETKEGLVVPFNLFLMLVALSRKETRERIEEKDQDYFRVSGRVIRLLHEMDKFDSRYLLGELEAHSSKDELDFYGTIKTKFENARRFARRESMCLDDLVVRKRMSDELRQMHYNGTIVRPFPVTIYSLKDPERWARSFARNHRSLLGTLKLRDLYYEQQNPF